jgi:H+-transporting ATPase
MTFDVDEKGFISLEDAKKLPVAELFQKLSSDVKGLSALEVEERLHRFGFNEIPEKKVNPFVKFLSYFWGLSHG